MLRLLAAFAMLLAFAGPALARGGGGCFPGETPVRLADGREVPLSSVRPGDRVRAFDAEGRAVTTEVVRTYALEADALLDLRTAAGERVLVTPEHPFLSREGRFAEARDLRPGDPIFRLGASVIADTVASVTPLPGRTRVFNLETRDPHTFVAGGLAVHNKGGGCFLPGTPILLESGGEIPISRVRPGDVVRAFDVDGRAVATTVRKVLTTESAVGHLELRTDGGDVLRVTPEHPLYVGHGTFRAAGLLGPGDRIFRMGAHLEEDRVREVRRVAGPVVVHNLAVDGPHTFVAGGLAVHNKGGGCFAAGTPVRVPGGGTRPIEALAPGDLVLAGDGTPVVVRVTSLSKDEVVEVTTALGALRTTAEHPLLHAKGRFREVGALSRASFLRAGDGAAVRVREVRPTGLEEIVHEIEVDEPHTYVAGGIVVHNKGGGGGFRSSGSRGGGSGNASPGGVAFGAAMAVFLFVIVPILVARANQGALELDHCFPAHVIEAKAAKTRALLEKIAQNDAQFTAQALLPVAEHAFRTLQRVWAARDYAEMRPLVFEDLAREHEKQIASMLRNHEANRLEDLQVLRLEPVHLRYMNRKEDRQFSVLIEARLRDYYVDDRDGRFIRGDRAPARFQEVWTFQLHGDRWLLREIEQTRETTALAEENVVEFLTDAQLQAAYGEAVAKKQGEAGPWAESDAIDKSTKVRRMLNFLVETDRVWNEKTMLDTARSACIAYHAALEKGAAAPLETLAHPELLDRLAKELPARAAAGERHEFRNLCVRKVFLVLVHNRADNDRDEFYAHVVHHAQHVHRIATGLVRQDLDVRRAEALYRFRRRGDRFLLVEVLPAASIESHLRAENVDEESTPAQLQWYYTKSRPGA